jgi:UDP-GlcNAc:undecaprenyl-phosphate GlcNAc-1-phosphate transferase
VAVLYGASILLGGVALALSFANSTQATWYIVAVATAAFLALRRLGYFNLSRTPQLLEERRRNTEMRSAVRAIGVAARAARTPSDLWIAVQMGARAVGASAVALRVDSLPLAKLGDFSDGFDRVLLDDLLLARYSLVGERSNDEHLELGWDDGRTEVDRDTEIAVELLCEHVAAGLERVAESHAQGAPMARAG